MLRAVRRILFYPLLGLLLLPGARAGAAVYPLPPPDEDVVGSPRAEPALPGDTLATLAFRHLQGFRALIHANPGADPWLLEPGRQVVLPEMVVLPSAPRQGIVVNVPEMRLYYYPPGSGKVHIYPVAVGRLDWKTPLGRTMVRSKVRDPVWYPPESIRAEHAALGDPLPRAVPPGPDNPLGNFALRLGWAQILIHGTNMPLGGIGMPVTHGCIRLYPADIETLFNEVALGTPVAFIDERHKLGRLRGQWYLESHAELTENPHAAPSASALAPALIKLKQKSDTAGLSGLDWDRVETVIQQATGLPVPVGLPRWPVAPFTSSAIFQTQCSGPC